MSYSRAYHDGIHAVVQYTRHTRETVAHCLRWLRANNNRTAARHLRKQMYWIGYPAK